MSKKETTEKNESNIKITLVKAREKCERIEKIKALKEKKIQSENEKIFIGIELIYNIMKRQNIKLLNELGEEFKSQLSSNTDLEKEFIKPPYLTPQIVAHKMTKILNQT